MFDKDQYELLDFGGGQKLERIAGVDVLRECPAASKGALQYKSPSDPSASNDRIAFDKQSGWDMSAKVPERWQLVHRDIVFNLKLTPYGHLGVFCEQAANWDWLSELPFDLAGKRVLNLFAYTGGSTLAMASQGAEVVHIDAAKNVVGWARNNAASSGLSEAPIRWIVDDALKFVNREIKRGKKYDIIIADPPSIGHAGKKMTWKFDRDIESLLHGLSGLVSDHFLALLVSCHTDGFDYRDLSRMACNQFALGNGSSKSDTLDLVTADGRRLNCGHFFRWSRQK